MATTSERATVGVYDDLEKAERTVDELRRAGFSQEEIGIIGNVANDSPLLPAMPARESPEFNVTHGVLTGGIIGAVIGGLVMLVIPGLGEVSGMGYSFEVLGGLVLGAAAGGVMFAYGALFMFKSRSRYFNQQLERGRYLVTVKSPQRQQEAMNLLSRQGVHVENVRRE